MAMRLIDKSRRNNNLINGSDQSSGARYLSFQYNDSSSNVGDTSAEEYAASSMCSKTHTQQMKSGGVNASQNRGKRVDIMRSSKWIKNARERPATQEIIRSSNTIEKRVDYIS